MPNIEKTKDIYVVRSTHLVPESNPSDSSYESTVRQLDVSRRIFASLIQEVGVDNLFFDHLHTEEAALWNMCLDWSDVELQRRVDISGVTEDVKDHFKWIDVVRAARKRTGINARFKPTEPKDRRTKPEDIIKAMKSLASFPIPLQINAWKQFMKYRLTGERMNITNLVTCLADQDLYEIVKRNSGARNAIYMGRAHKLREFYRKDSGFRTVGVTLEDDLTFSMDSANAPNDLICKFRELVESSIKDVTAI